MKGGADLITEVADEEQRLKLELGRHEWAVVCNDCRGSGPVKSTTARAREGACASLEGRQVFEAS